MEFENDIFISYAHIDNETLIEKQKGWISAFHRALEVRLAQLLGKHPKIFRDPKLQGNDVFGDRLVEELPKTATLVSILSPRYVKSEWCSRELVEFCKASQESIGLRLGTKSRVFKVVKTPVPFDRHPDEVQDLLGYEFYLLDPATGRAHELSQEDAPVEQRQYWAKLNDLAYDLCELLEQLGSAGATMVDLGAAGPAGETVYLAETSIDLREDRNGVMRALQQQGHTVLPDRPLPLYAADCEERLREEMARCRMSIHMVGANYGIVPEGTSDSLIVLQNEVAIARGAEASDFLRLLWMPPGLETDDQRQQEFIATVRTDPRIQLGADLMETPLADFQIAILEKLAPEEKEEEREGAPTPAEAGDEGPAVIYLICEQRDADATGPLEDFLYERGFEVVLPLFDGDETEIREEHEESLRGCDGVIIYYGAGSEAWQRRMLREVKKSAGYGRTKPMRATAIYVAGPETPQKQRLRTREALVLRQGESFAPDDLGDLLVQLEAHQGGK